MFGIFYDFSKFFDGGFGLGIWFRGGFGEGLVKWVKDLDGKIW